MDFSVNFNQPEYSDVILQLKTVSEKSGNKRKRQSARAQDSRKRRNKDNLREGENGMDEQNSELPEEHVRSLFVHRLVLSTSEYFQARLQRWKAFGDKTASNALATACRRPCAAGSSSSDNNSDRLVLVEHVTEEELDAAELVLKCMYRGAVPESAAGKPALLLQAYRIADRFQVPKCMEFLAAALAGLQPIDLDLSLLHAVYSLPTSCLEAAGCLPLLKMAQKRLLELFYNVPSVIAEQPQLLQQFCSLPHAAVLAWLKLDALRVHSENCVVYLLSCWIGSQAQPPSSREMEELAHNVRVSHCTSAYLLTVLPTLTWFRSCSGMMYFPHLTMGKFNNLIAQQRSWLGPAAWQAPRRTGTSTLADRRSRSVSLTWTLDQAELQKLYTCFTPDQERPLQSKYVYANGFFFLLEACMIKKQEPASERRGKASNGQTSACTFTLSVCLRVADEVMEHAIGSITTSQAVRCAARVSAGPHLVHRVQDNLYLTGDVEMGVSWGCSDFLGHECATAAEVVAPFLVDDNNEMKLVLEAQIHNVQ